MIKKKLYSFRRYILKNFVPEIVWPKSIEYFGTEIPVRFQPFSFGVKRSLLKREYEVPEITLFKKYIESTDSILEMGGSVGILTSVMGSQGNKVISIEADSSLVKNSEKLLSRYANVRVLHGYGFPVESLPSGFKLEGFQKNGPSLGGKVRFSIEETSRRAQDQRAHDIFTFEDIYSRYQLEPNFLVADIEGSEAVLSIKEMRVPAYVKKILIELHPSIYGEEGRGEIHSAFLNQGFELLDTIEESYFYQRA